MRPQQWYKNLILFAGIFFSLNLFNVSMWLTVLAAFLIFCMISGSEYLINDVIDREKDRVHPCKSKRPIASGALSLACALSVAVLLILSGLGCAWFLGVPFFVSVLSYLVLILAYSLFLKHLVLIDLLTIASGFVIRAVAGCVVIGVLISPWLILCAFFLALLLALGKRRHELVVLGPEAVNHRKLLENCSAGMLDQLINVTAAVLIISYSLYTFLIENLLLMVTIPVVAYGIFRYLYLIHAKNYGGDPERLFKDRGLTGTLIVWILIIVVVLYSTRLHTIWW